MNALKILSCVLVIILNVGITILLLFGSSYILVIVMVICFTMSTILQLIELKHFIKPNQPNYIQIL